MRNGAWFCDVAESFYEVSFTDAHVENGRIGASITSKVFSFEPMPKRNVNLGC